MTFKNRAWLALTALRLRAATWIALCYCYPWSDGTVRFADPTYGRIDRDIQWYVHRKVQPESLGQMVAIENNIQRLRDSGRELSL